MAARIRTLPAAIAPVLVGTALAGWQHVFHPLRFVAALVGAIFIQVGTNLSNDYSDARRGADAEDRLGPGPRHRRRPRAAQPGAGGDLRVVRRRGARRRLPRRRRRLAAAARRRRLDPRGRAVHRRPQALRLRGPRRAVRVPVLRDRRGRRLVLRAGQAPRLEGVRARRAGWPARLGDPRRQQLPRHRLRPPRRQTHARGPLRPRQDPRRCSR